MLSRILILASTALLSKTCEDDLPETCAAWAESGECEKNPAFMKKSCQKSCHACPAPLDPQLTQLGEELVIMEIENYGKVTFGFYPNAAPVTVKHIGKLFRLGCYDTNHIFRVDKGFVAQVQSVHASAVTQPLSAECESEAAKNVPGEFTDIPHTRGVLSMGRFDDPNSGGSSFSMLLGRAQHLDHQYTVFGKVIEGDDVLAALERVETRTEGIFVMPKYRITISRAFVVARDGDATATTLLRGSNKDL